MGDNYGGYHHMGPRTAGPAWDRFPASMLHRESATTSHHYVVDKQVADYPSDPPFLSRMSADSLTAQPRQVPELHSPIRCCRCEGPA